MTIILLKLLLAHLIADFVIQTPLMLERRKTSSWALLPHVASFAVLSLLLFLPSPTTSIFVAIAALALAHLTLDWLKTRATNSDEIVSFLIDQAAHLALIWVAASYLAATPWLAGPRKLLILLNSPHALILLISLVLTTATGSVLIGKMTLPFLSQLSGGATGDRPGMRYAGTYIGVLERLLILLFVLTNNLSAIGFIFAAKSLIRFPETKDAHQFTEYFLIGTTSSFGFAIIVGLATKYVDALV